MNVSIFFPPSRNDQINAALLGKLPEIQQRLYILFSGYKDFNSFGNKAWAVAENLSTVDSLEAVHDVIHIYGGLKGHMTYVPLSAFDPIFFMHHAMTDRLVAIWQILNPKSWIQPMATGETSYNSLKGTVQQSSTPLTPFFKSHDGAFWTSDDARTTQAFGYTYADTDPFLAVNQNFRGELARKITSWYGGSSPIALRAKATPEQATELAGGVLPRDSRFESLRPNVKIDAPDPPFQMIVREGTYTEWVANVHVNVEALDGSFTIHFFVGEPPIDISEWEGAQNHIGSVNIFAMDRNTGSQSKISGTLPLTSALLKLVALGAIPSLDPAVAGSYLRSALQFRVVGSDDSEIDPRWVEGLFIGVSSSEVRMPDTDLELPQWGNAIRRLELWPTR
jgi:tyrosinase